MRRVIPVTVVVVALAGGCGDGGRDAADPGATRTSTTAAPTTAEPSTTGPSVTVPESPTTAAGTTTVPADAPVLTADDATLRPVGPDAATIDVDPQDPCAALAAGRPCGVAGALAWVGGPGGFTVFRTESSRARPVLELPADLAASVVAVTAVPAELDGAAGPELVVGIRQAGTAGFLDLDVVGPDGTVEAHASLDRGRAVIDAPRLRVWQARYGPDDPNCCPSAFAAADVARGPDGRWYLVVTGEVPTADVPTGAFA